MADTLGTIIPILLILIGVVWLWSVFGEPMKRFYEWVKGLAGSNKERFQKANPATYTTEFTYQ